MTTFAVESFMERSAELLPLFVEHHRELAQWQGLVPLAPWWPMYRRLEMAGELLLITARRHGRLVGYFVVRVGPHLHYAETIFAQTDLPYVIPEVRGRGIGVRMFRYAETELRKRGAQVWTAGTKLGKPLHASMDRLLTHMQFAPVDLYYQKWLGD